MGLSASQARLLNLTARMHDIEYKAQNLEAQKLQMANESRHVYQEYEDALNKQKVQLKSIGSDGSARFNDVTFANMKEAGYCYMVTSGSKEGCLYNVDKLADALKAADSNIKDPTTTSSLKDYEKLKNALDTGLVVLVKVPAGTTITDGTTQFKTLQETKGEAYVFQTNIATDTNLQEVTDEVDLKKAEAKYEADMRKINQKDKKFDTDLAAMDNERNAIKTEMETLKSVAKENVDRTFKLFS